MTTKKRKGGVSVAPLRAGLSLCNLSSQDGQQQQDNEDTQPGLPQCTWPPAMVGLEPAADGQEHQERTRGATERNHHRGKAGLATPAGCRWARGTPEDGKQPGQESHHCIPAFTDTPTASQQVP